MPDYEPPALGTPAPIAGAPGIRARYLTDDLPPIGGVLKARPEDFVVDEEPLYEPCGSGEHIYLFVEKRGRTTHQAIDALAAHFKVNRRDIGYAGLKDANAVTRQHFSVHTPGRGPADFPEFRAEGMTTLWADLHTNKLRVGHLRANRFSIRVRAVRAADARTALHVLDRLEREGVPNFLGEQRFGARATNDGLGRLDALDRPDDLLSLLLSDNKAFARADYAAALAETPRHAEAESAALRALARGADAHKAVRAIPGRIRQLWMNALQSRVFNELLADRLDAGALGSLRAGDLAWKHDNGAVFAADDETASSDETRARLARLEISPSGPLWGVRMTRASGETGRAEDDALARAGITVDDIASWEKRTRLDAPGARRPFRVPLKDPDVEGGVDEHGEYVRVSFELPPGAYATAALREIMKPERAPAPVTRS